MRGFAGKIRNGLSYSNVVATIALFIALGGSAYAVSKNSVGTPQLKNNAVKVKKIANNAVTGPKIKKGSVTSSDIADGTITAADLGAATVIDRPQLVTISSTAAAVNVNIPFTVPPSGLVSVFMSTQVKFQDVSGGLGCLVSLRPPGAAYNTVLAGMYSANHPNFHYIESAPGTDFEGAGGLGNGGWVVMRATPGEGNFLLNFSRVLNSSSGCQFQNFKLALAPVA